MRKTFAMFIILTTLITTSGCYDRREVDDMAYLMVLGLDKGVTDKLRLTLQYVSSKGGDGGGDTKGDGGGDKEQGVVDGTIVVTLDCPSLFAGLNMANTVTSREFNLMHAKLIIFSEELAKSGEFENYISSMVRFSEIRKIMNLIVTRGKAADFILENKALLSKNAPKDIDLIMRQGDSTGFFPPVNLFNFYCKVKSTTDQPVAILANVNNLKNLKEPGQGVMQEQVSGGEYLAGELPRKGETKREYFGAAVFRGTQMVGEINGDEVRALEMVRGEFKSAYFTINDPLKPGSVLSLHVHPSRKPKVKVTMHDGTPEIEAKIMLEGDILALESKIHYENPILKPVLEQAFEQEIKNQIDVLVDKCQKEYKSDIFGFGRSAIKNFLTIEDWNDYRWIEKFTQASVNTEVKFVIRRTGLILESSPAMPAEEGFQ